MNATSNVASRCDRHASGRPLREVYDWNTSGEKGKMMWLDKHLLHVDHTYQRRRTSQARILKIAKGWDWPALGVIGVFCRDDGTYWIYDGQHRHAAALKRDDITTLPCIVFQATGDKHMKDEAEGFVGANTVRGAMSRLEKFRAELIAESASALATQDLIESCGYKVGAGSNKGTIACVESIERALNVDRHSCEEAFLLCASVADKECFTHKVFNAVFYLETHLRKHGLSVATSHIREKLHQENHEGLLRIIVDSERYHGSGGAKAGAEGLVKFINKGRRTRHVPSIFAG